MNRFFCSVLAFICLLGVSSDALESGASKQEHDFAFEHFEAGGIVHLILLDKRTGECWNYVKDPDLNKTFFCYIPKETSMKMDAWLKKEIADKMLLEQAEKNGSQTDKKVYIDLGNSSEKSNENPNIPKDMFNH